MNLESLGIPTVTFVTEPFLQAARTHAKVLGVPDIPLVVITSDYLHEDDDVIRSKVEPVLDTIVADLLLGARA